MSITLPVILGHVDEGKNYTKTYKRQPSPTFQQVLNTIGKRCVATTRLWHSERPCLMGGHR